MKKHDLETRERIEIEYWRDSSSEGPESFTVENLVQKISEAQTFLLKVENHSDLIERSETILEIGAGQGWASCVLKRMFPEKTIFASDISQHAIESLRHWEEIFKVKIDRAFSCRSYEIPLPDESVDLVFCYESAHHFADLAGTLRDSWRVLRDAGACIFLHEPSCRRYIYPLAFRRVNRKRPEVPEDVLIFKDVEKMGRAESFDVTVSFDPLLTNRGPVELVYYLALSKLKPLQSILPCSADYTFKK